MVQLPYLGIPITEFMQVATDDGWTVDVIDEDDTSPRAHVRTLEVRHDEIICRVRGGKVVKIGWGYR